LLSGGLASSEDSEGSLQQVRKLKKLFKNKKKRKQNVVNSKITFDKIHKEFGRGIQYNRISGQGAKLNKSFAVIM